MRHITALFCNILLGIKVWYIWQALMAMIHMASKNLLSCLKSGKELHVTRPGFDSFSTIICGEGRNFRQLPVEKQWPIIRHRATAVNLIAAPASELGEGACLGKAQALLPELPAGWIRAISCPTAIDSHSWRAWNDMPGSCCTHRGLWRSSALEF